MCQMCMGMHEFEKQNEFFNLVIFSIFFKMVASISSHIGNITSQYIHNEESDFYAVCIKMCSFPNTFIHKLFVCL